LHEPDKLSSFERAILPHLDAAYNLARWLVRNQHDAEDMVQEAYLKAFTFFSGFRGEESRAWLLSIVRNTCYTWLKKNRARDLLTVMEDEIHQIPGNSPTPEALQLAKADRLLLHEALDQLPTEFREVLILRELEGLSYKQIASVVDLPVGTVMSRLSRARQRLSKEMIERKAPGGRP
jgi:RNA polymerase sigma-70 factor (ECF subfamily)